MFAPAKRNQSAPRREAADVPPSHLGTALRIDGHLESEGALHIHGRVTGRVDADHLIIEESGAVEGDVLAADVKIAGRFSGRIFAPNVAVEATADVQGRIFHTTVTVARGAKVDGRMPWRPAQYFQTLEELPETQP
ncbi:MAG TPA: polymer-forming cytoskeletal protein [Rhizomicrobium sp.]|jgi:cytoskeletal protein CcmA (bactofilin family)